MPGSCLDPGWCFFLKQGSEVCQASSACGIRDWIFPDGQAQLGQCTGRSWARYCCVGAKMDTNC